MNVAPCKGCEKRHVGCHSECEAYKAYRTEQDKIVEIRQSVSRAKWPGEGVKKMQRIKLNRNKSGRR